MSWDGIINTVDSTIYVIVTISIIWLICAIIVRLHGNPQAETKIHSGDKVKLIITDTHAIEQIEILTKRQDIIERQHIATQNILRIQNLELDKMIQDRCLDDSIDADIAVLERKIADNEYKLTQLEEQSNKLLQEIQDIQYNYAEQIIKE